jgi:hypothetical protein
LVDSKATVTESYLAELTDKANKLIAALNS